MVGYKYGTVGCFSVFKNEVFFWCEKCPILLSAGITYRILVILMSKHDGFPHFRIKVKKPFQKIPKLEVFVDCGPAQKSDFLLFSQLFICFSSKSVNFWIWVILMSMIFFFFFFFFFFFILEGFPNYNNNKDDVFVDCRPAQKVNYCCFYNFS